MLKDIFVTHFGACMLFLLLIVEIICHAFMVHAHRDATMITWIEGIIEGTITPLVGMLANKQGQLSQQAATAVTNGGIK